MKDINKRVKSRKVLHILRGVEGGVPVVVHQIASHYESKRYEPIILFDTTKQSQIRKNLSESCFKTIEFKMASNKIAIDQTQSGKRRNIGAWLKSCFGKRAAEAYFSLKASYEFMMRDAPKINLFVKAIRENGVNLIHTHSSICHCKAEIIAARITGVPCISHNHGYPKLTNFDKFFFRFVDMIIHISKDVCEYQVSQGLPRSKGVTIHNGIELYKFSRQHDPEQVKEEFNIKLDETIIGIIGRIDWWKGHEYFLKAIEEVTKKIPKVKGLIIGGLEREANYEFNRQYFSKLKSLVTSSGLNDKIIFTGPREDIPRLMSVLDIAVHASSNPEPFGLVIIEAMAAGKPVIATAAGGVLDIIEDGKNGLLVPVKDSQAMAQAMLQIISDKEKAKQMSLAARRRVSEAFTIQHQVTAIQELYDTILGVPCC